MSYDPTTANPLYGNPLRTRADMESALKDLFEPLLPYFSPGNARVRLSATSAHFDRIAADIEGFARPLWGITPLAVGGGAFAHWDRFREGLANGMDPDHPEYWGQVNCTDQRMVEMAAIGFTLRMVPDLVWKPLSQRARDNIARYLTHIRRYDFADNNWKFFRVLIDLGLEEVGVEFDHSYTDTYLEQLDGFYIGDGWYRDGNIRRIDHYIPFAMHYYGLIYAALKRGDDARCERYRERAALFAKDIEHWFDEDGGALAFGRSLTYRFACGGFWGALAFAGVEALPLGRIKGHCLRHLRWWADKPIADRDGVLSVGYGYPNLIMSENYNSAGSPYWAFKTFLPLALKADHPFWQAREEPMPAAKGAVPLKHPGMVMINTGRNAVALSSGQENPQMRFGAEKYAKFAYSSRYSFSVESDERIYSLAVLDSMIGFSDDGRHFRVREINDEAKLAGDVLYARWRPWDDVTVETWLIPQAPWHLRVHRITTPRPLHATEGGFAIGRADMDADGYIHEDGYARAENATDISVIYDLSPDVVRQGRAHKAPPNTNLIHAKSIVPQLLGAISAGTVVLACAVAAVPAGQEDLGNPPPAPDLAAIETLVAEHGVRVSALEVASKS